MVKKSHILESKKGLSGELCILEGWPHRGCCDVPLGSPFRTKALTPQLMGVLATSTGLSFAERSCLSWGSSSGDSLHPITGQCGIQRPNPIISVLNISEESPQLQNSPGVLWNCIPGQLPLQLCRTLLPSLPRKHLHTNHLIWVFQETFSFVSSRNLDQTLQWPPAPPCSYSVPTEMQDGTFYSKADICCIPTVLQMAKFLLPGNYYNIPKYCILPCIMHTHVSGPYFQERNLSF